MAVATATRARYDSGDYEGALDRVLEAAGYGALRAEQAGRRERGDVRQLGIGLSVYVEVTGGGSEYGEVVVEADGRVTARTGVSPSGQGHETAFARLVADRLGVADDQVTVVHSDTAALPRGDVRDARRIFLAVAVDKANFAAGAKSAYRGKMVSLRAVERDGADRKGETDVKSFCHLW